MKHELWKEKDGYTFCLAGPIGDDARASLSSPAELIWTVDADSHFEAMTKYYEFMGRGDYKSDFEEYQNPYPADWVETPG